MERTRATSPGRAPKPRRFKTCKMRCSSPIRFMGCACCAPTGASETNKSVKIEKNAIALRTEVGCLILEVIFVKPSRNMEDSLRLGNGPHKPLYLVLDAARR